MISLGLGLQCSQRPPGGGVDPAIASAVVTGAGTASVNVTFPPSGQQNGRNYYLSVDETAEVVWSGFDWSINNADGIAYSSPDNVAYPWLATTWLVVDGSLPAPTVTMG